MEKDNETLIGEIGFKFAQKKGIVGYYSSDDDNSGKTYFVDKLLDKRFQENDESEELLEY